MIVDKEFGEFQKKKDDIYYNKDLNLYLLTDLSKLSRKALGFSPTDGFTKKDDDGNIIYFVYGKAKKSKKDKDNKDKNTITIKLSDIMEDEVDEKYYLSDEQVERLMTR